MLACDLSAFASGTFVPPPLPQNFKDIPIDEKIDMGDALFHGRKPKRLEALPGRPCADCHSGSKRLTRRGLVEIRDRLEDVIAQEHLTRYGAPADDMTVKSLYYYIYFRWRLER